MKNQLTVIVRDQDQNKILEADNSSFFNKNHDNKEKSEELYRFLVKVLKQLESESKTALAFKLAQKFHIEPYASITELLESWNQTIYENDLGSDKRILDLATQALLERFHNELISKDIEKVLEDSWKNQPDREL